MKREAVGCIYFIYFAWMLAKVRERGYLARLHME